PAFGLLPILLCAASAPAATWNEGVNGDLSNNQLAPTPLALTLGSNSIIGSVNGSTDSQDWIALTVPARSVMTTYVNSAYNSPSDVQGFTGFQFGSTFPGSPFAASSYAGFAHFGTGANNNGVNGGAAQTTVGVNLLPAPYMADATTVAQGATGFTPPLGPGTY